MVSKDALHILLVEDDIDTLATMRALLHEIGMVNIHEAADMDASIRILDDPSISIDIIVSDWNLPQRSGLDFLMHVRKTHEHLPFLMVTGRGDHHSVLDAAGAGVTSYLQKPFTLSDLSEKMDLLVAGLTT